MNYLDIRISELLTEQEAHLLRSSQPLGWRGLMRSLLDGRLGRFVRINLLLQLIFLIGAVWTGIRFFQATEVLPALKSGLASAVLLLLAGQYRASLIPQLQAERVLRALKRVEILILAQHDRSREDGKGKGA